MRTSVVFLRCPHTNTLWLSFLEGHTPCRIAGWSGTCGCRRRAGRRTPRRSAPPTLGRTHTPQTKPGAFRAAMHKCTRAEVPKAVGGGADPLWRGRRSGTPRRRSRSPRSSPGKCRPATNAHTKTPQSEGSKKMEESESCGANGRQRSSKSIKNTRIAQLARATHHIYY